MKRLSFVLGVMAYAVCLFSLVSCTNSQEAKNVRIDMLDAVKAKRDRLTIRQCEGKSRAKQSNYRI